MTHLSLFQWLPLGTAIVWFGLAAYQVARDRYRTWTEVFYLALCVFVGMYGVSDLLFFNTPSYYVGDPPVYDPAAFERVRIAALASFSSITLGATFFMLFGIVFLTRMRNALFLSLVPPLILLPFLWSNLVVGFHSLEPDDLSPPYVGDWNRTWYLVWGAYVLAHAAIGAVAFFLTYRVVTKQTKKLRGRMRGLMLSFILVIAFGSSTNLIRGATGTEVLPLFSTALMIPGLVAFVALSPLSKERLSIAVRRWKARHYLIKAAFLTFDDGTLIGSKVRPGETMVDQDLFSATLDVIQNFMRTSFPGLRGHWLKSITHGDYTLVMERGRKTYLTLVITGLETDQLRRQMRDALLAFEAVNRQVLLTWKGLAEEARGTDEFLSEFFLEEAYDDLPAT